MRVGNLPAISEITDTAQTRLVIYQSGTLVHGPAEGVLTGSFATAAQGALADTAVQPDDLADVATTGDYNDLLNKPTIGTGIPAGGATGQVLAKQSGTDYDAGWEDPDHITPEDGGFSDVYAAAGDAVTDGYDLYLTGIERSTTDVDMPHAANVFGPGCDNVVYQYMAHPVGAAWADRSRFGSLAQARIEERMESATVQADRYTSVSATGTAATGTWTALTFTLVQDGMGGFQSGASSGIFPLPGRYEIFVNVTWDANATGTRSVGLTLDGTTSADIVAQRNRDPVSSGADTPEHRFEVQIDTLGQYFGMMVYQSSGGNLGYDAEITVRALHQLPVTAPGSRLGLSAGPWADIETQYGGVDGLIDHLVDNYDTFIFCNILASNDDGGLYPQTPNVTYYNCVGAWANSTGYTAGNRVHDAVGGRMVICLVSHTSAAGPTTFASDWAANPSYWREAVAGDFIQVASVPWDNFPYVIRKVKERRPEFEAFAYISASIDAYYTDSIGGPITAYDGSRGYLNVVHYMDRYDRMVPELDGYFFDFFNSAYITATARNFIVQYAKWRKKKVACNTIAISAASLRFIAECPYIGRWDAVLNEGFEYDSGVSKTAETDDFLAELAKHRARGIRSFAFCEEASAAAVIPGSAKDVAAYAKFLANYVAGDAYGYTWSGYTTI